MPKTKAKPAKAKVKAKTAAKSATPDWLRKAMAPSKPIPKPKLKSKPKPKRKPMPNISKDSPLRDPLDDPDFKAGTKDEPKTEKPKGTPLTVEAEPEPAPLFDEVAAGEPIPAENAQALIAGTMGGGGDQHAMAKRILERMANEANWLITKGAEGTPAGVAIKAKKEAYAKAKKEAEDRDRKEAKAKGKEDKK